MIKSVRNNTSLALVSLYTDHGMGFTTACLAVGKHCAVVTIYYGLDKGKSGFVVDLALG